MNIRLHRVHDPRFMAVDVPASTFGMRRVICTTDVSPEELQAQCVLEWGQCERLLRDFAVEDEWRTAHRLPSEPRVSYGRGERGELRARADSAWRQANPEPAIAVVHALLDASGTDEAFLKWLLGDEPAAFLFLVTPPDTARHLPPSIDHGGTATAIRVFPWVREKTAKSFDVLAEAVWFELSGPTMALRERVKAVRPIRFTR
jgi:hypothetical protein